MKRIYCLSVILLFSIILSGCGETSESADATPTESTQSPAPAGAASPPSAIPSVSAEPSPEPDQKKDLTDTEELALSYITVYLNGSDLDAKKKFVDDNVHPDSQKIFRIAERRETPAENKLLNPQVVDSVDYKSSGKDVTAVLLTGEKNGAEAEIIILAADGKVALGFSRDGNNPKAQKAYDDMRARFK